MNTTAPTQDVPLDSACAAAVEVARSALSEAVEAAEFGEHLGVFAEGQRVATHHFECTQRGYRGWVWSVTVSRTFRRKDVTVSEIVLVPGEDAIVAPTWLPYKERLKPGDLSPGDLLPVEDDDPRLVPTYTFGDDDDLTSDDKAQVRRTARELGLERVRTLSVEGRDDAAQRWYASDRGPRSPLAKSAPETCESCGFLVRLQGPLTTMFGVCANGNANDDGGVVSLNHGCGAHSEVQLGRRSKPQPLPGHVFDTLDVDRLD